MKSFIALAVSLIFTGDILLDRGVRTHIGQYGIQSLFTTEIDSLFSSADVVVGNLECPATDVHAPIQKFHCFRADPEWLDALREHGFTHLNLANNHSVDQGRRGLRSTWQNIRQAGMVPVGAGENMTEASRPVLLWSEPEVWLIASNRLPLENFPYLTDRPCVSQLPIDTLVAQVEQLRHDRPYATIIISLHWGAEHTLTPVPQQRQEAHRLVDAGADALICHHAHCLQSIEDYKGHPIYYGIGNYIFDQTAPLNTRAGIVRLTVNHPSSPQWGGQRGALQVETIPININNCTPQLLDE